MGGMSPTRHFRERACERGLRSDVERFIVCWGAMIEVQGVTYFTILDRELPPDVDEDLVRRARGWVLVVRNGYVLTCYRQRDAYRAVRRRAA